MKTNKYSFLDTLQDFIESYLPLEKGCSEKTVESYKTTYRLLLDYLYNQKNLSADQVTFEKLDYGTISGFLDWLQTATFCGQQGRISRTVRAILNGQPELSVGQRVLRPTDQY